MRHTPPHPGTPALGPARGRTALTVLRVATAAGLGTDAAVHARLAPGYQGAAPGGIGEGTLFLAEAGAAALAGLWVLARGSAPAFAAALAVAATGLAALLLYRYADIPPIGPLPAMYEPVWFPAKALAAAAEALAAATAATALALLRRRRRTPSAAGAAAHPPPPAAGNTPLDTAGTMEHMGPSTPQPPPARSSARPGPGRRAAPCPETAASGAPDRSSPTSTVRARVQA